MAAGSIKVKGLREFQRACNRSSREVKSGLKRRLLEAGEIVAVESRSRFASVDARSAAGYRAVVRARGVSVEQRLPRTTGLHPGYGAMQMRTALEPALEAKRGEVIRTVDDMLGDLIHGF